MKESIKFIVDNKKELDILKKIINENNDIEIVSKGEGDKNNSKMKNEIIFRRNKTSLEQQIDIIQLLYVIIGGGIAAIIKCITDVIEKYLEYSKGKIQISKGDSTIEFEYKLSNKGELIVNEELIRNIILSEDKKEQADT